MPTQATFRAACDFIKKNHAAEPSLLPAVDALLGTAMVLSPVFFGPIGAPVLALLGVKNELVKAGKLVYEKVTKSTEEDVLSRHARLSYAYCFVSYAAFFDALDEALGEVRDALSLPETDTLELSEGLAAQARRKGNASSGAEECDQPLISDYEIGLPHPTEDVEAQCLLLGSLYEDLANGAAKLIENTSGWEAADEERQNRVSECIRQLPNSARNHFRAYYVDLALRFEEFCVWANLYEHEEVQRRIKDLSRFVKHSAQLAKCERDAIDIGLANLGDVVNALPGSIDHRRATHVVEGLERTYANAIDRPIIEDKFVDDDGKLALAFPKKKDIFIPQSYRVLRVVDPKLHLEDEATWEGAPTQDTLASFVLRFLNSPHSLDGLLVILGHPGSGKSLLTEILAARLSSQKLNPFRVELRDIDAESEIDTQIESQIYRDTGRDMKWANLSVELENPPLVILDGYDELLQASGKVFRHYLTKVRKFQEREFVQGRPVRVVATSRITLIDKAALPRDTTVVRLEDFGEGKQKKWIEIWNRTNRLYFENGLKKFALPKNEGLRTLAAQPLLLLMLALYDSDGNQLHESEGVDQTSLYNSLLSRFIERERRKGEGGRAFAAQPQGERDEEIDRDMHRLGVAAIGMLNRRKLHILARELNKDLVFFKLERTVNPPVTGVAMTQADLLLGSFFFIHESRNRAVAGEAEAGDVTAAFEFLHNTFGEFLTADFILRTVMEQAENLFDHESSVEAFPAKWHGCLMFTPLYSRPVVLSMLGEWFEHSLGRKKWQKEDFLRQLDRIVMSQIRRILTQNAMPDVLGKEQQTPFGALPLLGHLATYSLNLLLVRTVVGGVYEFDEASICEWDGGPRPWDRLAHLWRAWLSVESLRELNAIWKVARNGDRVRLTKREQFGAASGSDRLEAIENVSFALADDVGAGLAGLVRGFRAQGMDETLTESEERLAREGIDVHAGVTVRRLQSSMTRLRGFADRRRLVEDAIRLSGERGVSGRDALDLAVAVENASGGWWGRREVEGLLGGYERELFHEPEAALLWLSLTPKARLMKTHTRSRGESGTELLALVLERDWRSWEGGALVVLVRLARVNRGLGCVERFIEVLLRGPVRHLLKPEELGPEGVLEIVGLAAEVGRSEWVDGAFDVVRGWLGRNKEAYGNVSGVWLSLVASLKVIAYEYGEEGAFEKRLGGFEKRLGPDYSWRP